MILIDMDTFEIDTREAALIAIVIGIIALLVAFSGIPIDPLNPIIPFMPRWYEYHGTIPCVFPPMFW